ncbi:MAG TPA: DUF488 domain-containing protein [Gemmataceae bacterium]|nr:DUF488 domain-containing protein [Gemmataceae bacterium]
MKPPSFYAEAEALGDDPCPQGPHRGTVDREGFRGHHRFLALLAQHAVEALVDIRRFPGSRKHPHFNRDNLAAALPKSGVEYHWLEALGGAAAQAAG